MKTDYSRVEVHPTPAQERLATLLGLEVSQFTRGEWRPTIMYRRDTGRFGAQNFMVNRDGKILKGAHHLTMEERIAYNILLVHERVWAACDA